MDDDNRGEAQPFDHRDVAAAERLANISFTDRERRLLIDRALQQFEGFRVAREAGLPNSLAPALRFDPRPAAAAASFAPPVPRGGLDPDSWRDLPASADEDLLAFASVAQLARLLRAGKTSSVELTRLTLERLKRYGPRLRCLVTLTEELALRQAAKADDELAAGRDRGALHGIPYGVKDLLAVPGYPTTWGAAPYAHRHPPEKATVVERLEEAGAVLVAKLSLGELAMGDVWFGGKTLNPFDLRHGSSGSSSGSASAVAAGLVPFAIGSETMGSIVSPSIRCGVVGLRPSANLVSRHGAMSLAWTLDKLGPLARSVEDCALVLQVIAGPDGKDPSVADLTFEYVGSAGAHGLRIGYVEEAFEAEGATRARRLEILEGLRQMGHEPVPVTLPSFHAEPIMTVLMVEAAAAFDELTRSDRDDELAQQGEDSWPNLFRAARLVPAVEYVQANRLRALAVREQAELFSTIDAYLCPTSHYANLYLTNATGNPSVTVPLGFGATGAPLPEALTVNGGLYGEGAAVRVAAAVERLTGPRPRPDLAALDEEPAAGRSSPEVREV